MPDTKSLCPPGRARDMRHFGQPTDASACTLCATFAWVPLLHSTPPPSRTEPNPLYYMPWQNLCLPLLLHGSLSVHPQLMLAPLVLSAWQKLFKILLLGATSKCQVFTITLPTPLPPSLLLLLLTLLLLLLVQFYLILMGFFLPPTAECIKKSQAHGSITHECVPQAPAVCA